MPRTLSILFLSAAILVGPACGSGMAQSPAAMRCVRILDQYVHLALREHDRSPFTPNLWLLRVTASIVGEPLSDLVGQEYLDEGCSYGTLLGIMWRIRIRETGY